MGNQIPRFKTHICFVSRETIPNLLLCLRPELKPEKLILLTSSEMDDKYKILAQNAAKLGIAVNKIELKDISFSGLSNFIRNFIEKLLDEAIEDDDYAFNITGGTKLMTIAAFNACNGLIKMFYVDTQNNTLSFLTDNIDFPLFSFCTVQNILNSYGFKISKRKSQNVDRGKIIQTLLNQPLGMIKILNALSAQAERNLTAEIKELTPNLNELLAKCKEAGLAERKDNTLLFADEECRSFCNGIWFEEHVLHALKQLKINAQITDYEGSVEIIYSDKTVSNQDAKPDNELDALFVRNNILYLVECKTCRMNDDERSRGIVYKLDSIHDKIGGVFARGILITLEPLSETEMNHVEKNKLIVINDIQKLKNLRKTFIEIFENEERRR